MTLYTLLRSLAATLPALLLSACVSVVSIESSESTKGEAAGAAKTSGAGMPAAPAYPSTYQPLPGGTFLIRNATLLIGNGERVDGGDLLVRDGLIAAVGRGLEAPEEAEVIDAAGRWVTPGIIDVHSHLGVYPSPGVQPHADGNEMTDPVTADVWAEHSIWPQDPQFTRALAGGVTTLQILPGSANLVGGRGVVVKNIPNRTMQAMKFPDAPHALKMACGENPKRVYGKGKKKAPMTRMGNVAGYRKAWIKAVEYRRKWQEYERKRAAGDSRAKRPKRDLEMETLVAALEGRVKVHMHCYRADEMAVIIDLSREFGYQVAAFHHAVEAYKIADLLAENGICAAMWADWWGFKIEAYDTVRENVAMVDKAGGCAIVHSDSPVGIQHLPQEAAKVMTASTRKGYRVDRAHAMRWLTLNPARALGIDDRTGTLEAGKMADVVLWDGDPFSVYTHVERVWIDGALAWDRADPRYRPQTDFELGLGPVEEARP